MPSTLDQCAAISRVAAGHHHLTTRPELTAAGISPRQIEHWQATGFLRRVERNVFLVASGTLDWETRVLSVCLSAGGVASHRSALKLHGLTGGRPGRPEITIRNGAKYRRDGVRVHESTDLHLIRPVLRDGIPTTPVARTVLDVGAVAPFLVEDAARDAVGRRLATWPELLSTLVSHSRRGRRGCGPLRAVLDEHYGDKTESDLERRFLRLIRAAGLPAPVQQCEAYDRRGFIMRLDFAYPELMIAIELDSVLHHATNEAFELDPEKRNRLKLAGWLLLEFTSRGLGLRPAAVCEEVATAIRDQTVRLPILSAAMPPDGAWRPKERQGGQGGDGGSGRRIS